MPISKSTKLLSFFLLAICAIPVFSHAEYSTNEIEANTGRQSDTSFDCLSYSKSGSVQAAVSVVNQKIIAGDVVNFKGNVLNENSFPLSSLNIFVKIAKKQPNGNIDIVDQFYAKKDLSIFGSINNTSSIPLEFDWKSPATLPEGEYIILSYVFVGNHFNMNGFDFSDDVATNSNTFYVSSNVVARSAYFDKSTLSVNGESYTPIGFNPEFQDGDEVTISSSIVNDTDIPVDATIKWTAYRGFAQNEQNIVDSKVEKIKLIKGERELSSYVLPKSLGENILVIGEIRSYDSKSYINVFLKKVRNVSGNIKLAGLGATGTDFHSPTLFACYTANNIESDSNLSLFVKVADSDGNVMFSDVSKAVLSNSLISYSKHLPRLNTNRDLLLIAELKNGEDVIDSVFLKYPCLGTETDCYNSYTEVEKNSEITSSKALSLVIVTLLVFLIIMLYFINHKREMNHIYKKLDENNDDLNS